MISTNTSGTLQKTPICDNFWWIQSILVWSYLPQTSDSGTNLRHSKNVKFTNFSLSIGFCPQFSRLFDCADYAIIIEVFCRQAFKTSASLSLEHWLLVTLNRLSGRLVLFSSINFCSQLKLISPGQTVRTNNSISGLHPRWTIDFYNRTKSQHKHGWLFKFVANLMRHFFGADSFRCPVGWGLFD